MKHISTKTIAGLAAFLLFIPACTNELNETPASEQAIVFGPQADTRAVVENTGELGSFSVWGWYTKTTPVQIFGDENGGTTVESPNWTYEGGARYWVPGATYNFYGVYPNTVDAQVSNGVITVPSFDCSATGNDAVDLMTAVSSRIYDGTDASAVVMDFNHLLSKVNIMATVEGGNATVTSVTFSGMATQGNYSSTDGWNDTAQGSFTSNESKVLNSTGVDLLGDMLLIPQTITENFKVSVTYTIDEEQKTTEIVLPTANASNWEAGKSYRYTLAFKGNNIIFTVNVVPWNHSAGGIITVE